MGGSLSFLLLLVSTGVGSGVTGSEAAIRLLFVSFISFIFISWRYMKFVFTISVYKTVLIQLHGVLMNDWIVSLALSRA